MKKISILSLFLSTIFIAQAQLATVEKIRAHYTKVNAAIATSIKQKTGMYCNELTVNKTGTVWPDVGNYQKTTTLWHSDEHEEEEIEDQKVLLEKAMVKTSSADTKSSEEYLFYQGELVFYYYFTSYKTENGPQQDEHRIYYNKGKLLKHDISKGSMLIQPETKKAIADDALVQATKLQKLFEVSGDAE